MVLKYRRTGAFAPYLKVAPHLSQVCFKLEAYRAFVVKWSFAMRCRMLPPVLTSMARQRVILKWSRRAGAPNPCPLLLRQGELLFCA